MGRSQLPLIAGICLLLLVLIAGLYITNRGDGNDRSEVSADISELEIFPDVERQHATDDTVVVAETRVVPSPDRSTPRAEVIDEAMQNEDEEAPRFVLTGRVLDGEDNQPIAGARVISVTAGQGDLISGRFQRHHDTRSGDDGFFELPDPRRSHLNMEEMIFVLVESPGYVSRNVMITPGVGEDGLEVVVVLGRGVEIDGRVEDDEGNPISDAHVVVMRIDEVGLEPGLVGVSGTRLMAETQTDLSGSFRLYGPLEGGLLFMLRASKEGYIAATIDSYKDGEHVLVLRRGEGVLTGTVTWKGGAAVPDAEVTIWFHAHNQRTLPLTYTAYTNVDGEFRLEDLPTTLAIGEAGATARQADGMVVSSTGKTFHFAGQKEAHVDIEIPGSGPIRGRFVRREDGAGLSGVRVSNVPYVRSGSAAPRLEERLTRVEVVTGNDGNFELDILPIRGRYNVYFKMPPGWMARQVSHPGRITTADTDRALTIQADRGHVYRGRLVAQDGNTGLGDEDIRVRRASNDIETTITDETGRFEFTAMPGSTVDIRAATSRGMADESVTLDDSMKTAEIVIRVGWTAELSGYVKTAAGEGVGDVRIFAHQVGREQRNLLGATTSDRTGYFYLENLPAEVPISLNATPRAGIPHGPAGIRELTLEPHEYRRDIEIILTQTETLDVYLYDENETPIEGGSVTLMLRTASGVQTIHSHHIETTNREGLARFDRIQAGDYVKTVSANIPGYSQVSRRVEEGEKVLHIFLEPVSGVEILVVDHETGQPVQQYSYSIRKTESFSTDTRLFQTSRGAPHITDGRTVFERVSPGRFRVTVEAGNKSAMGEFVYQADGSGDPSPWTLEVKPSPDVVGRVVHRESGEPVGGVSLALRHANHNFRSMGNVYRELISDEGGTARFQGVAVGEYFLVAVDDNWSAVGNQQVTVGESGPNEEEYVLKVAGSGMIRYTLLGWHGEPESRAQVRATPTIRNRFAPFLLRLVGEGKYEVEVPQGGLMPFEIELDGYRMTHTESFHDATSDHDVKFDLSEYTRVEAVVNLNGAPWTGSPATFHIHRLGQRGNLHGGNAQTMRNSSTGHGRMVHTPGWVSPVILEPGEGWISFGLWEVPDSREPVTIEFDLHEARVDVGIVFPPDVEFQSGELSLYHDDHEHIAMRRRMTDEAMRLTIGYTRSFRLEFKSFDGGWFGRSPTLTPNGGPIDPIVIDVYQVE